MKKLVILFIALTAGIGLYAKKYVPTPEDLNKFTETKTLVVLDENPLMQFNTVVKEIFANGWDITKFDFIDTKEFEEKRTNPEYSFILITTNKYSRDRVVTGYKFLTVILGSDVETIEEMPELISFPIAYAKAEEETYIYKMGAIVNYMQNHLKMAQKNPKILKDKKYKYIKKNIKQIKQKEIWITEGEVHRSIRKIKKLKAVYPHKIVIKTADEIQKAVAEKNKNVIVMHKVGPEGYQFRGRLYKIIMDASGEKMYYFKLMKNMKTKPDAWLDKDFKKFAK